MERRAFLGGLFAATLLARDGLRVSRAGAAVSGPGPYGPLLAADANGIQLPAGFSSRLVATTGVPVAGTSHPWHLNPDGGACFTAAGGGWIYVSNCEVGSGGGGVGAIRFEVDGTIAAAYEILTGTSRNCAGGPTPWGTWLSCEESGPAGQVFECDPQQPGQGVARPLLGAFNHEAAAVDPTTGHVYLTEDEPDSRLYRFTPAAPGDLTAGALHAAGVAPDGAVTWIPVGTGGPARDPLTAAFDGGEGAWLAAGTLWFTTKGDARVWALDLASQVLRVVFDFATTPGAALNAVDNITHHDPSGDLFVAEDGGNLELCVISQLAGSDTVAPFLRFVGHDDSEVAGPAFSPDGTRLYVSSQRGTDGVNGRTYEITGPFRSATTPAVETLVAPGSTWRYLDDGSEQGAAWTGVDFVDAGWAEGPAPLGYGDPMATIVGYGPDPSAKHITTYFRRTFEASHGFAAMTLHLRSDDGAVAYVNGLEVARDNMPAGPSSATTPALVARGANGELAFSQIAVTPVLYAGTNVVAVEVHQQSGTSSDVAFDLTLQGSGDTGPLPPRPGSGIFPVTADAHVRNGVHRQVSFGSAATMEVLASATAGETRMAFVQVDTAGITGAVDSARLRFWCRNAAPGPVSRLTVLAVPSTLWAESAITWANKPALGSALGSFSVSSDVDAWYELDVTSYVDSERLAGRNAVAFALRGARSGQLVLVRSREGGGNGPELVVNQ